MAISLSDPKIQDLIAKYGVSVPRYTSYPTAPEWKQDYSHKEFEAAIIRSNETNEDYSLYLHIPFCESQCYYCGCNVVISEKHGIEEQYLNHLKEELTYLGSKIDKSRKVSQMAWGGGTPTYLRPEQIKDLYEHIEKNFNLYKKGELSRKSDEIVEFENESKNISQESHEYSIEIDPRVTTKEQLETLYELGFNRLSLGIQDFNLKTQEAINRIQDFTLVDNLVKEARTIGFKSINFDLIYGLPYQSISTFTDTIEKVKVLDPERIALFNYAHIPSMLPFQKKYIKDETLPEQKEKLAIFDKAVEEFTKFGYEFIGLDHFAKPDDELAIAQHNKSLYRNFQGFTTHSGCDLFSAGITAISDVSGVYKQNYKKMNDYYEQFLNDEPGAEKFMLCSGEDLTRREMIKQLMCNNELSLNVEKYMPELESMSEFVEDGLLEISSSDYFGDDKLLDALNEEESGDLSRYSLKVTELGRFFVRNIASKFDTYISKKEGHKVFSKAL